jgi:hypothetical protein
MVSEDFLKDRAEEAAERLASGVDVEADEDGSVKIEDGREFEAPENDSEALEREEAEFFSNNRHKMGNEEMKEFLKGETDFQQSDFERFSEAEEEVVMRNFPMQDAETIAEKLERPEEEVRKKIKMLGLGNRLE